MSAEATTTDTAKTDGQRRRLEVRKRMRLEIPHGLEILHDPAFNKGTAFTLEERQQFDLRGLVPPGVATPEMQEARVLENYERMPSDLERYIFLKELQDRNETLFYRVLINHIHELMPIVYTPTVGTACKEFGHIYRRPRGLYISADDKGSIGHVLQNWPYEAEIIVVTDGERILGLGDLGANGMGIPIGKLSLYTACAGVHPESCLPITLDVGTDNEALLQDPMYLGLRQNRLRGQEYADFLEEFVTKVLERFPSIVLQFEDFATRNAFELLQRYRTRLCTFNDDIQGTAAVVLAGLLSAQRMTDHPFIEEKLIFLGAGEAAVGIADLVVAAAVREGVDEAEALARIWFIDSKGLVVKERTDLQPHKIPYAQDHAFLPDLASAVEALRPSGIIGVSGQPDTFTEPIVRMHGRDERAPDRVRPLEPDHQVGMYGGAGVQVDGRPSGVRERQPLRPRGARGAYARARTGEQRVHLPGRRARPHRLRSRTGHGRNVLRGGPNPGGHGLGGDDRPGLSLPAPDGDPRSVGRHRYGGGRVGLREAAGEQAGTPRRGARRSRADADVRARLSGLRLGPSGVVARGQDQT